MEDSQLQNQISNMTSSYNTREENTVYVNITTEQGTHEQTDADGHTFHIHIPHRILQVLTSPQSRVLTSRQRQMGTPSIFTSLTGYFRYLHLGGYTRYVHFKDTPGPDIPHRILQVPVLTSQEVHKYRHPSYCKIHQVLTSLTIDTSYRYYY